MKCLRATWGLERSRVRFLYLASVEPILLYGCFLKAPFLNTKNIIKRIRKWQRTFLISINLSFKTVSTDALLVLANVVPLDLRVSKITALRFRTSNSGMFYSSSLKWLYKFFPYISLKSKFDHPRCPSLPRFLSGL